MASGRLILRPLAERVKCVMIVDDEGPIRIALRRFLEIRGWRVIEATSGEAALALLVPESVRVDAVLVDMNLPGLSGSAFCARLKALRPSLVGRLMLASGDAFGAKQALDRERMQCPVLAKPFDLEHLEQMLDSVVAAG
jgi:two-component system cell cycle sensor histidine kinase/response regulator CckA